MKTSHLAFICISAIVPFFAFSWGAKTATVMATEADFMDGWKAGVVYVLRDIYFLDKKEYYSDHHWCYNYGHSYSYSYTRTPQFLMLPAENQPQSYNPNGPVF